MDRFYLRQQIKKMKQIKAYHKLRVQDKTIVVHCHKISQNEIQKVQEKFKAMNYSFAFVRTKLLKLFVNKNILQTICYGNTWLATTQTNMNTLSEFAQMEKQNIKNLYCAEQSYVYKVNDTNLQKTNTFYNNLAKVFQNITRITAHKNEHVIDYNRIE